MSAETGPAAGRASVESLPDTWRRRAKTLRRYGAETSAVALEACAAELETALRQRDETTLTLTDAASKSGYSADHLGRLVREGKIPNAGRPGAPRIAHRHLPLKAMGPAPAPPPLKKLRPGEVSNAQIVQAIIEKGLD